MSPPNEKGALAPQDERPSLKTFLTVGTPVNACSLDYDAVDRSLAGPQEHVEDGWWLDEQAAKLRALGCPALEAVKYAAALSAPWRQREQIAALPPQTEAAAAQDEFVEGVRLHGRVLDVVEREADGHGKPSPMQVLVAHLALDFVLRRGYLRGLTIRDCAHLLGVSHTVFHRRAHRFSVLTGVPLERGKTEDTRIALSLSHRAEFRSVLTVNAVEKGDA